jgi:hypothetical protein
MWKIFSYNQATLLKNYQKDLAQYQGGVCLALAMKWCVSKKKGGQSSLQLGPRLIAAPEERQELASWMKGVQDVPLKTLFDGNGKLFPFKNRNGKPTKQVIDNTGGKVNNLQAYAYRLEQMSTWGRKVGLSLLDDRVAFPQNPFAEHWVPEMVRYACAGGPGRTLGLISLTGSGQGHALAYQHAGAPAVEINFFDPNFGEYCTTSVTDFTLWLTEFVDEHYPALNEHWWVVKYT